MSSAPRINATRRSVLAGGGALWLSNCASAVSSAEAQRIAAIEAGLGGARVGVCALDTGRGQRLTYRGDERFAMCSTFKWILAALVLQQVERGALHLSTRVSFTDADLQEYAPVVRAHLGEGSLSVEELCAAIVEVSDNSAANLLLDSIGGPTGVTAFVRAAGDDVTRLDNDEPGLNQDALTDPSDTSTPNAMTATMERVLLGDVLSPGSRAILHGWMISSTRGLDRLRAGLPPGWRVGDKTGTGDTAIHDLAIAWPPGRAPILISCFISEGSASTEARIAAQGGVARMVARAFA